MAVPRFYVPGLPENGQVDFPADEARHCTGILRMSEGDDVVLFDGKGGEATATLHAVSKRCVTAAILRRTDTNRELAVGIEAFVALPKGDRQKTLIESAVQLGVTSLTPLAARRSVSQPTSNALERLRRQVIEASKQCGRNRLMQIGEPVTVDQLAKLGGDDTQLDLVAHPYGDSVALTDVAGDLFLASRQGQHSAALTNITLQPETIRLAIGPEGGFVDSEVQHLAENGWHCCTFGARILRVETALLAGVAALAGPFLGDVR